MRIDEHVTAHAALTELGRRLAQRRLDLGWTQAEVARSAGVGKRTLERLEAGGDAAVSTLVNVLRVLGLADGLERLVPEAGPRPLDLLELHGGSRRRASRKRGAGPSDGWRWGDER